MCILYVSTCTSLLFCPVSFLFFFKDTATSEIYTLSLHDALPISRPLRADRTARALHRRRLFLRGQAARFARVDVGGEERSEEHTSELQSQSNLVCRLLLEKKKKIKIRSSINMTIRHCTNASWHLP